MNNFFHKAAKWYSAMSYCMARAEVYLNDKKSK